MWTPLNIKSHYSILQALSKPKDIARMCSKMGYKTFGVTDVENVASTVQIIKHAKNICKNCHEHKDDHDDDCKFEADDLQPIIGCEFYIKDELFTTENQISLLAINREGWDNLVELVSLSNTDKFYDEKPTLNIEALREFSNNLIAFSGGPGSILFNSLFGRVPDGDLEQAQASLSVSFYEDSCSLIKTLTDIYDDRFFVEINLIDKDKYPASECAAKILRTIAMDYGIKTIATASPNYCDKKDVEDHRVLICSYLKASFAELRSKILNKTRFPLDRFFKTDTFHLPTAEEMQEAGNTENELNNTNLVGAMCETYDITAPPVLPKYEWTEGLSEDEFLRELCIRGWNKKNKPKWNREEYGDRMKKELGVIREADLPGYFLIVQDYVNEAKNRGWLVGAARGSGAGSLTSYLLGITCIDPIPGDLIFERFYNAGRNTKDRVSLPDIDVDFPKFKREEIIEYIRERYGRDRVCQMVTFGRMSGRGAVKDVFRVHSACSFEEANEITKYIPQEAEIADQLESSGETSIIKWTLDNEPELLKDYCRVEQDGSLTGDYAQYFEQAIRLEGTFKSKGKHAAGLVISARPLHEVCPMIKDKSGDELIAGMDMNDLEDMGHVKFDILGVTVLDKLMGVNNLLRFGKVEDV